MEASVKHTAGGSEVELAVFSTKKPSTRNNGSSINRSQYSKQFPIYCMRILVPSVFLVKCMDKESEEHGRGSNSPVNPYFIVL
jgi:hypothetical protein